MFELALSYLSCTVHFIMENFFAVLILNYRNIHSQFTVNHFCFAYFDLKAWLMVILSCYRNFFFYKSHINDFCAILDSCFFSSIYFFEYICQVKISRFASCFRFSETNPVLLQAGNILLPTCLPSMLNPVDSLTPPYLKELKLNF